MTPVELRARADADGLPPLAAALWHAGRGAWDEAHEIVQGHLGAGSDWVHAYLHRVEGDLENARYWYGRAGKPVATGTVGEEWETLVTSLG